MRDHAVRSIPGIVLAAMLWQAPGAAADEPMRVVWASDQVTFVAPGASELVLTVTGPGYARRERGAGWLLFRPVADDGSPLPDGRYRFELREVPPPLDGEISADEPGRRPRPRRAVIESARFRIEAGAIVEPAPKAASESDAGAGGTP